MAFKPSDSQVYWDRVKRSINCILVGKLPNFGRVKGLYSYGNTVSFLQIQTGKRQAGVDSCGIGTWIISLVMTEREMVCFSCCRSSNLLCFISPILCAALRLWRQTEIDIIAAFPN